jgi:transketolase
VDCAVAVVASVSPAPVEDLARFLEGRDLVLTVEVHYPNGGVGSLVSEVVAERGLDCRVVRCAVATMPAAVAGSQAYLERLFGLAEDQLAEAVLGAR